MKARVPARLAMQSRQGGRLGEAYPSLLFAQGRRPLLVVCGQPLVRRRALRGGIVLQAGEAAHGVRDLLSEPRELARLRGGACHVSPMGEDTSARGGEEGRSRGGEEGRSRGGEEGRSRGGEEGRFEMMDRVRSRAPSSVACARFIAASSSLCVSAVACHVSPGACHVSARMGRRRGHVGSTTSVSWRGHATQRHGH